MLHRDVRLSKLLGTLLVLAACLLPGRARADAAAEARFHDELARGHYRAGRYESAIREFFLEQRLAPNPRTLFNIALCFEELRRAPDAFLYYSDYLASTDATAELRAEAEAAVARIGPTVARVAVRTEPAGARIFIDDRAYGAYGTAPRSLALDAGTHRVWAELEGYRTAEASVTATVGAEAVVTLSLEQILGALSIEGTEGGTAVVRGEDGAVAGEGALPLALQLPPGIFEVVVDAPGHRRWRETVRVREEAPSAVAVVLEPLPPPTGDLTVTASARGAVVELDGEPRGFAPTVLAGVSVGAHRLAVRGDGLLPWEGEVEVRPEARSWVTVALEPEGATVDRSGWTWVAGGVGLPALIAGAVLAGLAVDAHSGYYGGGPETGDPLLRERGEVYATAADALLVGGAALTTAAVVLYFATESVTEHETRASITVAEETGEEAVE